MLYFTVPSLIHVSFFLNNYPNFAHRNIVNALYILRLPPLCMDFGLQKTVYNTGDSVKV